MFYSIKFAPQTQLVAVFDKLHPYRTVRTSTNWLFEGIGLSEVIGIHLVFLHFSRWVSALAEFVRAS